MYTAYLILGIVLVASFITGNIVMLVERNKSKEKKLIVKKDTIIDEEIL